MVSLMARWTVADLEAQLGRRLGPARSAGAEAVQAPRRRNKPLDDMVRQFLQQLELAGVPAPVTEYRFCPDRLWRADFAWPSAMVLAEYEGGIYTGGRHTRGKAFEADCVKYNTAALLGFRVLRFTHDLVKNGTALQMTEQALAGTR